jgi:hypothetical protein
MSRDKQWWFERTRFEVWAATFAVVYVEASRKAISKAECDAVVPTAVRAAEEACDALREHAVLEKEPDQEPVEIEHGASMEVGPVELSVSKSGMLSLKLEVSDGSQTIFSSQLDHGDADGVREAICEWWDLRGEA